MSLVAIGFLVLSIWILSAPTVAPLEVALAHEIKVSVWTSQSTYQAGENVVVHWHLDCFTCDGETSLNDVLGDLVLRGPSYSSIHLGFIARRGSIGLGAAPPNSVGNWIVTLEVQLSKLFGPDGTFYGSNQFQIIGDGSGYVGVPNSSWPSVLQPPSKGDSSILISVNPESSSVGENVTVRGAILPARQASVTLRYTRPAGLTFAASLKSESDGSFAYTFKPDESGSWTFSASWAGDTEYFGVTSAPVILDVKEPAPPSEVQFLKQLEAIPMGVVHMLAALLVVLLVLTLLGGFILVGI